MVTITNTSHNLAHFAVRDQNGSYDNPYNQALIEYERSEAFKRAGSHIVHLAAKTALKGLRFASHAVFEGLCAYIESANVAEG